MEGVAMEEVTRIRCSAVFVPEISAGMCPHYSCNARTLFARLRYVDTDLVAIVLFLVLPLLVIHIVLFVGIAMAQAWSVFTQKAKMELHKSPVALMISFMPLKSLPTLVASHKGQGWAGNFDRDASF